MWSITGQKHASLLSPTIQRINSKRIFGFDIETCDNNKTFLLASVYDGTNYHAFYDKKDLIDFFKTKRFRNSIVAATNLGFDFFGTFFGSQESKSFNLLFRGSSVISSSTYHKNKEFTHKSHNSSGSLTFIDTMNYAPISVDKLGKILKIPKLKESVKHIIGKRPRNREEWDLMLEYNKRDSLISREAVNFFYNAFHKLGATPKKTIASTSMSLFRNKFLKDAYWRHQKETLLDIFKGYYGANTHAYGRGLIENYKYYDFNSLYPSVMLNEFPDPNSVAVTRQNTNEYIDSYDGMSDVTVYCPEMEYPLLPFRMDKLLYPHGTFRGWYTHVELKQAMRLGYVITKVHKTIYYKKSCMPMRSYVLDLWDLRRQYQKENNPMEIVVKLFMNSLYGKFGQKFMDKDNMLYFNHTIKELQKYKSFERVGDFLRVVQDLPIPSYCIPIWAAYVTAYGRLKLHEKILECQPVYVDTDSLITKKNYASRTDLGHLKLEMRIKRGIIVKPKCYFIQDSANKNYIKTKGLGIRLDKKGFFAFLKNPSLTYNKFMKIRESIRRNYQPNEIVQITKSFNLEDDKRLWEAPFDMDSFMMSKPHYINNESVVTPVRMEQKLYM